MTDRARRPAGAPTGGQFTVVPRAEPTWLADGTVRAAPDACRRAMLEHAARSGQADAALVRAARSRLAAFTPARLEDAGRNQLRAAAHAAAATTRVDRGQSDARAARMDAFRAAVGALPDEGTARAQLDRAEAEYQRAQDTFRSIRGTGTYRRVRRAELRVRAAEIVLRAVRDNG